ncbi:MAG: hypothetical protein AAFQ42_08755 [Pseudomonadota bacterium]
MKWSTMVAIDARYDAPAKRVDAPRGIGRHIAELLGATFSTLGWLVVSLVKPTAAEIARREQRVAAKISSAAGVFDGARVAEVGRVSATAVAERLDALAGDISHTTTTTNSDLHGLEIALDSVDYELAAIRADIAPYLPNA